MESLGTTCERVEPATVVVPPEAGDEMEEKTVLVLGAYRGGTSMVSCALHHLGVPMLEGTPPSGTWEDPVIRELIARRDFPALADVIARRNGQPVWGWKDPATIHVIGHVLPLVRRPHLVVITRDVAAVQQREAALGTRPGRSLFAHVIGQYQRLLALLTRCPCPLLLVSYERATRAPADFLRQLIRFLGIAPSADQVLDALRTVQPGSYYMPDLMPDAAIDPTTETTDLTTDSNADSGRLP
jgi:hypothetical protein